MTIKHKILLWAAVVVLFSVLVLIVFGDNGLIDRQRLEARYAAVVDENAVLAEENARLYWQIDRLRNDPAAVEMIARRELGMIGRDELVVKPLKPVVPARGLTPSAAAGR
jgi:cell division protein FtsB